MTKLMIKNRTDARKTDVNLFFTIKVSQKGQNEVKRRDKNARTSILLNLMRPKSKTCLPLLLLNGKKGDSLLVEKSQIDIHIVFKFSVLVRCVSIAKILNSLVCPLIDNENYPMSAREFLQLF